MPARGAVQIAAAAVLAAVALAACSSNSGGSVALPSLSSSGSTPSVSSSSSTGSPSSSPSDAQVAAEVEAAVRAYFDALNEAVKTGRTQSLLAITSDDCTCAAIVDEVRRIYAKGRIVGGAWDLKRVEVDLIQRGLAGARVVFTVDPYITQDAYGMQTGRFDGHAVDGRVSLRLVRGVWAVSDVDSRSEQSS